MRKLALAIVLLTGVDVSLAPAQAVLDRVVEMAEFEQPLVITKLDAQTIGMLARAAGVPMGLE
jgi:hypothetical protein